MRLSIIWAGILWSIKNDIIKKLNFIENISFNFEQNINDKIEKGNCILQYPKKIFCKYNLKNEKILHFENNNQLFSIVENRKLILKMTRILNV